MGLVARCHGTIAGAVVEGEAHLDTAKVDFRPEGGRWQSLTFAQLTDFSVQKGVLVLTAGKTVWRLELGSAAEIWWQKIRYPKSRAEKLGLVPGQRVGVKGTVDDPYFESELADVGVERVGATGKNLDVLFFVPSTTADLTALAALSQRLQPAGMIWVLWPKGRKELTETHVRDAALKTDLVDVKVLSFSPTLSGLKLVIRKDKRATASSAKPAAVKKAAPRKPAPALPDDIRTALEAVPT
ncbi:MAG: hypothetical protein ABI743_14185, partial [bacterium]